MAPRGSQHYVQRVLPDLIYLDPWLHEGANYDLLQSGRAVVKFRSMAPRGSQREQSRKRRLHVRI